MKNIVLLIPFGIIFTISLYYTFFNELSVCCHVNGENHNTNLTDYFISSKSFKNSNYDYPYFLKHMTDKSVNLTRSFQNEVSKWNDHTYSNATMAKITENYLPKFVSNLNEFKNNDAPPQYTTVKKDYVKSYEDEIKSYQFFEDFLKSNNATANKLPTAYLTNVLNYETMARSAFVKLQNDTNTLNHSFIL
ncbi:MAG TPA: hypothetical protein VIY08_13640 [Candidatus Nitrosocosmicus sp.]